MMTQQQQQNAQLILAYATTIAHVWAQSNNSLIPIRHMLRDVKRCKKK